MAIIATADDVRIGSDRFGAGLHRNPKFIGAVHHENTMPDGSEARPVPWRLLAAILTAMAGASSPNGKQGSSAADANRGCRAPVGGFAVKIIARRMAAVPPSPEVAPSVRSGFGVKF
jgi:hypothetical protein